MNRDLELRIDILKWCKNAHNNSWYSNTKEYKNQKFSDDEILNCFKFLLSSSFIIFKDSVTTINVNGLTAEGEKYLESLQEKKKSKSPWGIIKNILLYIFAVIGVIASIVQIIEFIQK